MMCFFFPLYAATENPPLFQENAEAALLKNQWRTGSREPTLLFCISVIVTFLSRCWILKTELACGTAKSVRSVPGGTGGAGFLTRLPIRRIREFAYAGEERHVDVSKCRGGREHVLAFTAAV